MTGDATYCYRVQSVGSYGIPEVQAQLLNFSQVICASPIDTTRPCPPVLALDLLNCEQYVSGPCEQPPFSNKLTWTTPAKKQPGRRLRQEHRQIQHLLQALPGRRGLCQNRLRHHAPAPGDGLHPRQPDFVRGLLLRDGGQPLRQRVAAEQHRLQGQLPGLPAAQRIHAQQRRPETTPFSP